MVVRVLKILIIIFFLSKYVISFTISLWNSESSLFKVNISILKFDSERAFISLIIKVSDLWGKTGSI